MDIAPFGVEDWLNVHEKSATYDIAQSTIASMTLDELVALGAPRGLVADAAEAAFPQDARAGAAQMGFFARLGAEKMNYGWIEGSPAFKRAAAALYGRVEPEAVLQTNGATGANLLAVLALVSRGDHVVAEYPSYHSSTTYRGRSAPRWTSGAFTRTAAGTPTSASSSASCAPTRGSSA